MTDPPSPLRVRSPSMVALVLVVGTLALSTDTYIAALPALRVALHTSASAAELTMTTCIAGMAVGQILVGPVSDARGRRGIVLIATVLFIATSAVCALTTTIGLMIAARACQGIAAGVAAAVGRASVSDTSSGRTAAARFGTLTAISFVAPVVGPVVGGFLLTMGDWRTIFWFLAAVGVAMLVAAFLGFPETLPPPLRHAGGLAALGSRTWSLVQDRAFIGPVLVQCLVIGGFFIYIGGSSLVLQRDLHLSPGTYALVFAVNAATMIASSLLFRILVVRTGAVVVRRAAFVLQTVAVLALLGCALVSAPHPPALPVVWTCLAAMTFGLGAYIPANSSIAQEAGRRYAGAAASLSGGLPFLVGALMTPFTGLVGALTVLGMASGMAALFGAAALAAGLGRLLARRGPVVVTSTSP